jgi:acyl-coenzyme A thioesterase PaaI-like protein
MALADGAAYITILSRIGPAALAVTTNLNINFLRRPRPVDLVADASLIKLGRTLALCQVDLFSDGGAPDDLVRPVAHSVVTYSMALLDGSAPGSAGITGDTA